MKLFSLFIILSVIFASFSIRQTENYGSVQLVAVVPQFSSGDLAFRLEKEFSSFQGVYDCEISLKTKTILIDYDARKVSISDIKNVFNKWGCYPEEYVFQKLYK